VSQFDINEFKVRGRCKVFNRASCHLAHALPAIAASEPTGVVYRGVGMQHWKYMARQWFTMADRAKAPCMESVSGLSMSPRINFPRLGDKKCLM
jgi:hypothetical protein